MRIENYGVVVAIALGLGGCAEEQDRVEWRPAHPRAIPISADVGMWNTDVEQAAPACTIVELVNVPLECYGAGNEVQLNLRLPSASGALISRTDSLSSQTPYVVFYNTRANVAQEVGLTFPIDAPSAVCSEQLSIASEPGPVSGFPVRFSAGGVTRFNAGAPWGSTGTPVRSDGGPLTFADLRDGNYPCNSNVSFQVGSIAPVIPAAGLHLWLRADAGVVPANGAQIARWLDQSGNGRNASMATVARQPSLVGGALNGRPVVRFLGAQSMYLDVPATPTRFSVFIVGKNSLSRESFSMILGPGGNTPNHQLRWENGSQALFVTRNAGTIITSPIGNTRVYHALSASYDGTAITFFRDGNAMSSTAFAATGPWTLASVGSWFSSFYMTGDLAEVILYDRALSEAERASVNVYLRTKYNLP